VGLAPSPSWCFFFSRGRLDKGAIHELPRKPEESKRLGCMRGLGILGRDTDIKAIGREEIIAMFEE
jgi:hypothetical protein